jgi:hypothetical protein
MKINVRVVIITIVAMLLIMLFFNNIFAETTTSNNIAGNKTNITEDSDSSESTDNSDIKNIGKNYPGKNYIVGNIRNDNLIDVSDAVDVLVIVANIYSWDFANSEAQDDYEIYQKLVEDGKISHNENIKSIDDLYNICDVDRNGDISASDASKILRYYAYKAAGNIIN